MFSTSTMLDIRWNTKQNIQNYRVTALQLFPLPRIQCWMTLIMNYWDTVLVLKSTLKKGELCTCGPVFQQI